MATIESRDDWLSVRASLSQKMLLAQAAKAKHMNLGQFVLDAAMREAEELVRTDTVVVASAGEYDWVCNMATEVQPLLHLRAMLGRPVVWHA